MDRVGRTYWLQRAAREGRTPRRGRSAERSGALILVIGLFGLFVTVGSLFAFTAAAATATAAWYDTFVSDFPSVTTVDSRAVFKTTRILDRNGDLLYELYDQDEGKRTVVRLGDMPDVLVQAFLAVEDATFFDNPGIEPRGIARALYQNFKAGTIVSGGSTITQQLIRNVLLDPSERSTETLDRKLKEAVLAIELSGSYSKQQILEWYLNEIYFGNLSYGVATAAKTYFNKTVQELTLPEAAFLAGLPQAPGYYDPFTNFSSAKLRQEEVLELMAHHRFISAADAEDAKAEPIKLASGESETTIRYPHWVFYVRSVLEERYGAKGVLAAGLTVTTTIDPTVQAMAEEAIARNSAALARQNANNAAMVAIDPSAGEVLAMVGSPDYYDPRIDGQVNNAVTLQQPGSSIKPLVYLTAFLKGFSPSTVVQDATISFPDGTGRIWRPQNHDFRFRGPVTLRRALGNSLNIPAVKVLQYAGLHETVNLAKRLGMTSLGDPTVYGLSFTLGGGEVRLIELATAYTVLANSGVQVPVSPILRIADSDGRIVFEHKPIRQQAVDTRAVFMINDILSDNSARTETFGQNSPLKLANDRVAAVKTGTSDDYRDTWTLGFTPSLVAGVWVGRSDNAPTRFVPNSPAAALIWNSFMERALAGWPNEQFPSPPGLKQERVCATTGLPGGGGCPQIADWFMEERAPSTLARLSARSIAIDAATGRIADRDTPYADVQFRTYRLLPYGEGPFPPSEYSDRSGVNRPWEVLPPTLLPTIVPTRVGTPEPEPVAAGQHDGPALAAFSSLRSGEVVRGEVEIRGSARARDFQSYRLDYELRDNSTGRWNPLREMSGGAQVHDAVLDRWDTTRVPNGLYSVRLTVNSTVGVASQTRVIVTVRNPEA